MSNTFFISDHHFGHANILTFKEEGHPLRVFDDVTHMNEFMVEQHNKVVNQKDKVYFLGDVAFGSNNLTYLDRMNGEKILIKGNHDKDKLSSYIKYFKDVRGSHQFDGMILTHIPIHHASLSRWKVNVHGHLHSYNVLLENGHKDTRYFCVCVEQHNYTPVPIDTIQKHAANL